MRVLRMMQRPGDKFIWVLDMLPDTAVKSCDMDCALLIIMNITMSMKCRVGTVPCCK